VEDAKENVKNYDDVKSRLSWASGDFFASVPEGGIFLIFLFLSFDVLFLSLSLSLFLHILS
jgi:hypothetical protein